METVLRVGFVYAFILVVLRVMGKRELSELTPLELVTIILIPEFVSQGTLREDFSMTNAVVAVTTLAALAFTTSALTYKFKRFGEIIEGKPSLLVRQGEMQNEEMSLTRIPPEEIAGKMRLAGIERLEDVKWAVLESGGKIAIIGYDRDEAQPPPSESGAG
jgi:uncharacterized membrane protein YcaP (DUF421 family)